jgi:high-affinity iron transporter
MKWLGLSLRLLVVGVVGWFALLAAAPMAVAEGTSWNDVADDMSQVLSAAGEAYRSGAADQAKALVNEAYYGAYESTGFEKTVMAYISGDRAAEVEYQFSGILKSIAKGDPAAEVTAQLDTLSEMLHADANQLDGVEENPWANLASSFLIILREGFEAILVVAAIIAYLAKSGNKDKVKQVYIGAVLALGASFVLAWAFNALTAASGASQEIVEGATMLLAAAMLIWVGNWILSKSVGSGWTKYIEGAVKSGGAATFGLAFVAFLAVFREGAETILFYQALMARTTDHSQIWLGMGLGAVSLAVVYLLIRLASLRIPLRPFFLVTSGLLALMAFTFTGGGIKELQEGAVVSATPVSGIGSVDLLGFYPTLETITAQAAVILIIAVCLAYGLLRNRPQAADVAVGKQPQGETL